MSKPFENFKAQLRAAGISIELAKRWSIVSQYVLRGEREWTTIVVIDGDEGFELYYQSETIAIDKDVAKLTAMLNGPKPCPLTTDENIGSVAP
jgi:hypothetical protein